MNCLRHPTAFLHATRGGVSGNGKGCLENGEDDGLPAVIFIPTGLRHSAQGCAPRATLGGGSENVFYPEGIAAGGVAPMDATSSR